MTTRKKETYMGVARRTFGSMPDLVAASILGGLASMMCFLMPLAETDKDKGEFGNASAVASKQFYTEQVEETAVLERRIRSEKEALDSIVPLNAKEMEQFYKLRLQLGAAEQSHKRDAGELAALYMKKMDKPLPGFLQRDFKGEEHVAFSYRALRECQNSILKGKEPFKGNSVAERVATCTIEEDKNQALTNIGLTGIFGAAVVFAIPALRRRREFEVADMTPVVATPASKKIVFSKKLEF